MLFRSSHVLLCGFDQIGADLCCPVSAHGLCGLVEQRKLVRGKTRYGHAMLLKASIGIGNFRELADFFKVGF